MEDDFKDSCSFVVGDVVGDLDMITDRMSLLKCLQTAPVVIVGKYLLPGNVWCCTRLLQQIRYHLLSN